MNVSPDTLLLGERPSSRHDFQVAIICALSLEAEMVELILDRNWSHECVTLGRAAGDHNVYTLGLLGRHNVVLAFMPRIGSNSAVAVASGLRSSFPNLEMALLVGVCGVSPVHPETGEGIALGDCVIGTDVVQYDFGRQYPQQFRRKTTHDDNTRYARPEVRSLIERLKTTPNRRHMATRLAYHLKALQQQEPLLGIQYPGPHLDRLFQADYLHTHHDSKDCISCIDEVGICTEDCIALGCEDRFLVRQKRSGLGNDTDYPSAHPGIHFGRFGSANSVMRSGIDRDRLAKQEKIVAFEMEGSGVCELLPTVVIKAACDYADSHKNKEWQRYAAAVSASATKAVLESIELSEREPPVPEAMSMSLRVHWPETPSFNADARLRTVGGRSEQVLLALRGPRSLDGTQIISKEHYTNVETWLFDHAAYKNWISVPGTILWIYGMPWSGKTVLFRNVFQEIRRTSTHDRNCVLYFSFQAEKGEELLACHLLQAVLLQSYSWARTNRRASGNFLGCHLQNGIPSSMRLLSELVTQILSLAGPAYLIVDALDECEDRKSLLDILLTLTASSSLSVLATSRQQFAAEVLATDRLPPDSMLAMTSDIVSLDMQEYVHINLQDRHRFGRWFVRPAMLLEVENLLVQKSSGSFRMAACLLDELETCLDSRMLKASLNSIPRLLIGEYAAISASIREHYMPYAGRLLQLLLYWPQSVRLVEAVDYLAIDPNSTPSFDAEFRMPQPLDVATICGNLVTISAAVSSMTRESAYIGLAHPSIKQFLHSDAVPASLQHYLKAEHAQVELSMASVAYLNTVINTLSHHITTGKVLLYSNETISADFPFLKTALWIVWQNSLLASNKRLIPLASTLQNQSSGLKNVMHDLAMGQINSTHITSTLHGSRKLLYCAQDSVWDALLEASSIAVRIHDLAAQMSVFRLSLLLWTVDLIAVEAHIKDVRGKRWTILPVPANIGDCMKLARRAKRGRNILIPRRGRR